MVTMRLCELALKPVSPGVLNVVHGGEDAVNAICDHADIKAISFVGPPRSGTHAHNRASLKWQARAVHDGRERTTPSWCPTRTRNKPSTPWPVPLSAIGQRCMASVVILVGESQSGFRNWWLRPDIEA